MNSSAVRIPVDAVTLEADLWLTSSSAAIVVFAHGSGSSRHSPRNWIVAEKLRNAGLATLLMDLLTQDEEEEDLHTRLAFDISLLSERLVGATRWLGSQDGTAGLRVGYFGASTGAAAALVAAARRPAETHAVVSRGGRPDLAQEALDEVEAPTLLIVGSLDTTVAELNRRSLERMRCTKKMSVVEGASHLFEEPGKLEVVAQLAREWFAEHLIPEAWSGGQ